MFAKKLAGQQESELLKKDLENYSDQLQQKSDDLVDTVNKVKTLSNQIINL